MPSYAFKLKSLDWFLKNALKKDDSFYPIHEKGFSISIQAVVLGRLLYINNLDKKKLEGYSWGIEEIYYPDTHPQYFI